MLLTGPVSGPATRAVIAELTAQIEAAARGLLADAVERRRPGPGGRPSATSALPRPRLDKADLIVGFGAEFLDRPADGLESDFAQRRAPEPKDGAA